MKKVHIPDSFGDDLPCAGLIEIRKSSSKILDSFYQEKYLMAPFL
jgi:hypothetical protein